MIRFSQVTFASGHSNRGITRLSFHIKAGEVAFFSGSPGSGVSLLGDLCNGFLVPDDGTVTIGGYDTSDRLEGSCIPRRLLTGTVSSQVPLINNRTVLENVSLPLEIRGRSFGKAVRSAMNALHALDIVHTRRHRPSELTADEQYRVALARAIVTLPRVIIADECAYGSHGSSLIQYPDLLRTMSTWGAAVIIASHDYPLPEEVGLNVFVLDKGMIKNTEVKRPAELTASRSYLMDLLLRNTSSA